MIGDDALRNLARRNAAATPSRQRLILLVIALPTAVITAAATVIGLAIDSNDAMVPLWLVLPGGGAIMIWIFVFGFLFLISLAAFAVGDRDTINDLRLLRANGASDDQLRRFMRFHSMIPGRRGVLAGWLAGLVIGVIGFLVTSGDQLQPLHWVTVPLGATIVALIAGAGVGLGARWPRPPASATGVANHTGLETNRPATLTAERSRALVTTAAGVFLVAVGSALFNGWDGFRYAVGELIGLPLLIGGAVVLIAGLVMLLPGLFRNLTDQVNAGPGWFRYALTDLGRSPGRTGKAAGASLILAILTVMATAGIESNRNRFGSADVELDSRYIITESARPIIVDGIAAALDSAPEINGYQTSRIRTVGIPFDDLSRGPGFGQVVNAAVVDDVLIESLDLTDDDLEALDNNTVLVNSNLANWDELALPDGLSARQINHGEGRLSPLGLLIGANTDRDTTGGGYTVFVTGRPMSDETRERITDLSGIHHDWIEVASTGFAPTSTQIQLVIVAVAGALAVMAAVSTSVLAAQADRPALDTVADLGLRPRTRRLVVGAQALFQQVVVGVGGSLLGIALFWLVTRGDPSVPDPIAPWVAIMAFTIVVPLITAALVTALHRPSATTRPQKAIVGATTGG